MRNLRHIHQSLIENPEGPKPTVCAWDVGTNDSVICAFGPSQDNKLLELKRWKKYEETWRTIASWDAPCPLPDLNCDRVLNLHFFSDIQTAVLVLAAGDLIVVREAPRQDEDKIEIVGSVDAGIAAAAWSPDEELLAIATRASTLLYMTRDFDNVVDVALVADDLNASNAVSVGWGKKETQFKGKKARALRDPTMPETVEEGLLHPLDDKSTSISWRGDGAFLAINTIEGRRAIRIYSRGGVLDSVSEPVDYLMSALSWRPAGNLVAGIQRLDNAIKIIFFERNGLRHGHFELRLSNEEMASWGSNIALSWNVDSSVLAVMFTDRVQLWTMNNYHYYLKQEMGCAPNSHDISSAMGRFCWHPEKPLHLLLGNQDVVQERAFASATAHGSTTPPYDQGLVAVIDGTKLKLTPMSMVNVPPPMAFHTLETGENVIDVAIANSQSITEKDKVLLAILQIKHLSLYEWDTKSTADSLPCLKWQISLSSAIDSTDSPERTSLQVTMSKDNDIHVLQASIAGEHLKTFEKSGSERREINLEVYGHVESMITQSVGGPPSSPYLIADSSIQSHAGKSTAPISDFLRPGLPLPCRSVATPVVDSVMYCDASRVELVNQDDSAATLTSIFFYLTENGSLFAENRCLVRHCTSFMVTPAHLIFTTSQHFLKFVHLGSAKGQLEVPPDSPESDERCRSIERGAKLVTVMPSKFALVLQMPRGNLETIFPRALVLAGIRDSINRGKYQKAFFACRIHRVDMNLLHDHSPDQFLANVGLFVDQIKKVEHIDLFLSQLREEDVSQTMYRETLPNFDRTEKQASTAKSAKALTTNPVSKVNRICDAFLESLKSRSSHYLQSIVSAHVCKSPPDLDAGLVQIAKLRKSRSDQVDAMIEHICFLADTNRLYDNALGLYDLELTLLIAQQSQKDPREYLPFLQNLQKMSQLRRQYSIDDFLRRHAKALTHLCEMEAFEEAKTYTVKHSLYSQALGYYRYQEDKLREVMRLQAEYLEAEGQFKEAGIAYEYLRDYTAASESFCQAHLWRESLSNASMVPFEPNQLRSLASSLSDASTETKDYHAAATINLEYMADVPGAARLFCKGYHYADAIRIVGLHKRLDLLESVIDPGLVEGMGNMTELLADCKSQLNAQIPRIRDLRTKKAEDPLAFWDGDTPSRGDVPDDVSIAPTDASTTRGSLFTRYTNRTGTVGTNATRRTSKNRRREERKRARGKKGSVYEEEYLVNSVGRLIERVNSIGDEVSRLVVGLMRRTMSERARAVEAAMLDVVEMSKGCLDEVFPSMQPPEKGEERPTERNTEGYTPQGGDAVLLESMEESNIPRKAPIVKAFESLSLLGR